MIKISTSKRSFSRIMKESEDIYNHSRQNAKKKNHPKEGGISEMNNYELLSLGDMTEYLLGYGFQTHPTGVGPLEEFCGGAVLPDRIKILLPHGLCFEGAISNHAQFFENLTQHPSRWELHFSWETKLPLIGIVIPELDMEFILALTPDDDWAAGYAPHHSGYDHLERFELREWFIPENLKGKVINVISPEIFGDQYC